jgi:hypothetical protein
MTQSQIMLLLGSLYTAASAAGAEWRLVPFESAYIVRSSGLEIGKLEQRLRLVEDDKFALRTESYATGLAALMLKERTVEESFFKVRNARIVPLEYHFNRSGGHNSKTQKIVFDRSTWKINGRTNANDWQLAWQPLTMFDNINYQIGLLRDVGTASPELTYTLVDNAETKTYHFQRQGEERVTTPIGEFQAIKIVRTQLPDQRATTLWSAPQLNYLPVRIDNTDRKGRQATALLEHLTGIQPVGATATPRR